MWMGCLSHMMLCILGEGNVNVNVKRCSTKSEEAKKNSPDLGTHNTNAHCRERKLLTFHRRCDGFLIARWNWTWFWPLLAVCELWTASCQSWLFIGQGMVGRFLCNYCWAQHEAVRVFPCSQPAEVVRLYSREQCCNGSFSVSQSWHLASPWWFSGFCKVSLSLENIVLEVEKNTFVKKLPGKTSLYSFLLLSPGPNLLSRFSW